MGLGDFFGDAWDKTKGSAKALGKVAITPVTLPIGATMDLARYATPLSDSAGPDWLSTKKAFSGVTDTLLGEGTLTGWAISQVGGVANDVYNGAENTVEGAAYYANDRLVGNEDAVSWSQAWDLAKTRNIGQSAQLLLNEDLGHLDNATGIQFSNLYDNRLTRNNIPIGPFAAGITGVGRDDLKDIRATDDSAWKDFQADSPFFSGLLASTSTIGVQFAADPFVLAAKATAVPRALRNLRPIQEGEEVGLAERMQNEKTKNILGVPSKKAGLQSRTDPLIGTVKYDEHVVDGKAVVDGDGTKQLVAAQDKPGWLDGKSSVQVYEGLQLKTHPYGDQIATLLSRTNDIKNPADKVNVRRDILAAMGGDAAANQRLSHMADEKEFAYTLSNAFRGRGTGELEVALADEAATAAGKSAATHADPNVVAGVQGELKAQSGFDQWLYASMKDRTLISTPKGNRALARLSDQGLGRDGSLHTGYTGFDDIVNDKVLGKFKSSGSIVDEALSQSDELPVGTPLRDGKVYQTDQMSWNRGPNSQPATLVRGGLKMAQWATWAKPLSMASDALRGRVVQGALNVEDAPLSIAVTQNFLRTAGVDAGATDRLLSNVVNATGPTARSIAVTQAQDHAIGVIADRYGVDRDLIAKIQAEHSMKSDATMSALRGQSYSAHMRVDETTGELRSGDLAYLPDDGGTVVLPILDTQTVNNLPLMDLSHIESYLKRDKTMSAVGQVFKKGASNEQRTRATELGFNDRVNASLATNTAKWTKFLAEESNSWWKRAVLLTRAPSYAMRNTMEEMMRVAAIQHGASTADAAVRQAAHRAADHARLRGDARYNDLAPDYARLELHKSELDDLRALHDDPEIVENVKAIRAELRALRSKQTRLAKSGRVTESDELRSSIEFLQTMPYLVEHAGWADEIAVHEKAIAGLEKALDEKVLPDSGYHTIAGFGETPFPDAYQGTGGSMAYKRVAGGGTFDQDVTDFAERSFSRRRGVGEPSTIMPPRPGDDADVIDRHLTAWSWIVNKQIRQDKAAQVALRAMSEQADDVAPQVQRFLESPAGTAYRKNNPHRAHDTEAWADEISEMVKHHAQDSTTAQRLLEGEVSKGELAELWPDTFTRPEVHVAGVDGLMGVGNRKLAQFTGRAFKRIDEMSVNAVTRHPLFSVHFQAEQSRLAADFARKAELEQGEGALVSLSDINNITERARKAAHAKVRETFYDTTSRSSAAQKLRFVYPFFAAHQNSMQFWGRAVMNRPEVLRDLQLAYQIPSSLGLVVDREGNAVKPGEFIKNDHVILLQVPKAWGGPDPQDPTAKQSGFRVNLSSFNLIMPNGSFLNPGAGPAAAIPAGYVQRKFGSKNDDVSKMLTWFNPYGAPKQGDSPVLPGALQALDPALPTPVRRLGTAWDAFMGPKNSREYMEMWSLRFQEAQVKFAEENERQPTKVEAAEMEKRVDDEVRHMAGLRFAASLFSPAQPQPSSRLSGFIGEYRKLQEKGRNENRGPFWASDTFLDKYGDEYMALTRSTSESRSRLDPTTATIRTLDAHSKLVDKTTPETWRLIVGGEGNGAFSMDAYRWMQDKNVNKVFGGGKLIDRKDVDKGLFNINASTGWREFTKANNLLMAQATQAGLPSVAKSPQLAALKSAVVKNLAEKYPDWYQEYTKGSDDYEGTYLTSIRTIASDKKLVGDPAREDIRQLQQYVQGRDAVMNLLAQRDAAGGSADPTAVSNRDAALLFSALVDKLAEQNTSFSDYAVEGLISRDPLYRAGLKVSEG